MGLEKEGKPVMSGDMATVRELTPRLHPNSHFSLTVVTIVVPFTPILHVNSENKEQNYKLLQ